MYVGEKQRRLRGEWTKRNGEEKDDEEVRSIDFEKQYPSLKSRTNRTEKWERKTGKMAKTRAHIYVQITSDECCTWHYS